MAGHSKWSNIKHRKGRQDAKRGKIFTKISKEIFTAVRNGGEDPATNDALKSALANAKAANVPNENIERTIKKATGNVDGVTYDQITYEGYGPNGVAIYVEGPAEVRLAFNKNGGNLGESGCVAFLFERKGYLVVETDNNEDVTLIAIDSGAEDVIEHKGHVEVVTDVEA